MSRSKSSVQTSAELNIITLEDLEYILEEWDNKISDSKLRIGGATLRRLLVEGNLYKVASSVRQDLKILMSKAHIIGNTEDNWDFWQAGGATFGNVGVLGAAFVNRALSDEEIKESFKSQHPDLKRSVKISYWAKMPSYILKGLKISREELIKYVCNKKGAVHFDESREPYKDNELLMRKYELLDQVANGNFKLANKDSIYFEFLSIGQALVGSRDIQKLRKKIKESVSVSGN